MRLLKSTFSAFVSDDCQSMAAALAYYTIFALPPLLYLLLTIVTYSMSVAYESEDAQSRAKEVVREQASQLIGNDSAATEISNILERNQSQGGLWWKTLLSFVAIMFGATGVMAAIQSSLNRVWHVQPDPETNALRDFLMKRVLSLGMILGLGFLLIVSLIVSAAMTAIGSRLGSWIGMEQTAVSIVNYAISFIITLFIFAAMFKFMPDAIIGWKEAVVGAGITTVLFFIGRYILGWYLSLSDPASQLGSAAASLAVLLVWIYYSSMVFLLGAEFTQSWARVYGQQIVPEPGAVRVEQQIVRRTTH